MAVKRITSRESLSGTNDRERIAMAEEARRKAASYRASIVRWRSRYLRLERGDKAFVMFPGVPLIISFSLFHVLLLPRHSFLRAFLRVVVFYFAQFSSFSQQLFVIGSSLLIFRRKRERETERNLYFQFHEHVEHAYIASILAESVSSRAILFVFITQMHPRQKTHSSQLFGDDCRGLPPKCKYVRARGCDSITPRRNVYSANTSHDSRESKLFNSDLVVVGRRALAPDAALRNEPPSSSRRAHTRKSTLPEIGSKWRELNCIQKHFLSFSLSHPQLVSLKLLFKKKILWLLLKNVDCYVINFWNNSCFNNVSNKNISIADVWTEVRKIAITKVRTIKCIHNTSIVVREEMKTATQRNRQADLSESLSPCVKSN